MKGFLLWRKKPEKKKTGTTVNLFGFYTYQQNLEGDREEIRRLLSLCGITVNCIAGADCTLESFRKIPEADLNILCCPERCEKTGAYLKEVLKLPVYDAGGFPIGFDQTERFVKEISELLHTDCRPALEDIEKARARAFQRSCGMRWKEKVPCCAGMWIIFPGILASGRKRYGNFLQKEAEAVEKDCAEC